MIEINIKYRVDFVGLSTDEKPSDQLENGSTYYTVDTQELYIYYEGEWYLQAPIETSSDETQAETNSDETQAETNEKKEEVKEPIKEIIEEPEITLETEPVEEKKSGDEK